MIMTQKLNHIKSGITVLTFFFISLSASISMAATDQIKEIIDNDRKENEEIIAVRVIENKTVDPKTGNVTIRKITDLMENVTCYKTTSSISCVNKNSKK